MPRENRKRGKKHKKVTEPEPPAHEVQDVSYVNNVETDQGQPSWIVSAPDREDANPEARFGYVDADVKAYFRTVDGQIRSWQEEDLTPEDGNDVDPNEERRLFFMAALTEMSDKEKQLATDPDCSIVLERMIYSMDDFIRRVFMDKFMGSFDILVKHRFASHVLQTFFTVAADTISRESRGIFPSVPESEDQGELRTLTQLVLDCCEELLPSFQSLIMDPFGSHVMRALILLLSPKASGSSNGSQSTLRSKKSAAWKAKQGPLKSVFNDGKGKASESSHKNLPQEFHAVSRKFVRVIRDELGENEVRALAASKVASPVLQMLVEVEADEGIHDEPGSLMDCVLVGIITACHNESSASHEPSDYVNTLLRDQTSSHLLETLVSRSPENAFNVIWTTYFRGKLARLSAHPVANFVTAKVVERANEAQLVETCTELADAWPKIIRSSRSGVLKALIDRAAALKRHGAEILEAVYLAFELTSEDERKLLVPCATCLLPLSEYRSITSKPEPKEDPNRSKYGRQKVEDPLEPKVQGALLLQSMLLLPEPHNLAVVESIACLPIENCIKLAHHPVSSRVLDALIDSPNVPFKCKRNFILSFMGNYHTLVDDRIGSRVGDRCWNFADTYLKAREKIARSLITFDTALAASYYGKYFARNLNLHLLKRKPDEWKEMQSERRRAAQEQSSASHGKHQLAPAQPSSVAAGSSRAAHTPVDDEEHGGKKRKRKERQGDEIDALFETKLGKKVKRSALADADPSDPAPCNRQDDATGQQDATLESVLGAIRAAPKDDKGRHRDGKRKKAR
ncbi:hypothetical protein HGRIS_009833 [Hohenbuehelia grisea]|uniref:Nucleolar protein 9 n=1 Tax=Hohenbuehelia grisea TaxID=104357 RepID=A0ABR3J2X7_9AGAR